METFTFHAKDSASALDLVQKRFGDDALILSMETQNDGTVEIVAAADPTPPASPMQDEVEHPRPQIDIVVGDVPEPDYTEATNYAPEPEAEQQITSLPSFLRRTPERVASPEPEATPEEAKAQTSVVFADAFQQAKNATIEASDPPLPAAHGDTLIAQERILRARRIVIVGPAGAGKSLVALQLAALRLERDPATPPRIIYCGNGSHSDAGFLFQKAHLLGLGIVFRQPEMIDQPHPREFQIVVVTGRGGPGPDRIRPLIQTEDTEAVIVLPAGLRKERIIGLTRQWGTDVANVIMSADPDFPATQADSAEAEEAGLKHLWSSDSARIVKGLTNPGHPEPVIPASPSAMPHIVFRHSHHEAGATVEEERAK